VLGKVTADAGFTTRFANYATQAAVTAGVQSAVMGTPLSETAQTALVNSLAQTLTSEVGDWGKSDWGQSNSAQVAKTLAHAVVQCAAARVQNKDCGSAALGAAVAETISPLLDTLDDRTKAAGYQQTLGSSIAGMSALLVASLTGQDPLTALNAAQMVDVYNRQLHPDEKQRIKELAKGDSEKEARLTAAACALVKCYAEYATGSATYNTLKAMADAGSSDAMAGERQQLQATQVLFNYSTQGLLSDMNIDAAKQINNTYQVTNRGVGAGQAMLGGLGVAGSVATAPVSCATGVGCVANAVVATLSADAALTGAKQLVSGQPENTSVNNALQAFGLSPEAASYAEFALGVGAAAKAGSVVNAAINQTAKMNELASSSYTKFNTNGVKSTAEVMNNPSVQALAQEIRAASPGISNNDLDLRLGQYLSSGSGIPSQATAGPGSVLVKIIPKGGEVSSYSPFWMSPEQVRSVANMTPEQASKALGLPSDVAWKMLNGGVDYYAITPKPGTTPKVFVSDIASTAQGGVTTAPTAQQVLVPNRSLWTDPKPINPFTLR
jgi:filamentous hemagglutinin